MTAAEQPRAPRELSPYIQDLIARAPRPTDEQARTLAVMFNRAITRAEQQNAAAAS